MKLIIAVVQDRDADKVLTRLTSDGHRATRLASTGGFLRAGNTTFLIGAEDKEVPRILSILEEQCETRQQTIVPPTNMMDGGLTAFPIDVTVGGATVWVLPVDQFLRF